MKGGGYLISDDIATSHKIKKMIQKEAEKKNHKMIQLYEENGVYNMYLEKKVPGSGVEVTTADGTWRQNSVHPWKDVGVLVKQQELDK